MTNSQDPVRWRDDPQSVPRELADGLRSYVEQGPDPELHARMRDAIESGVLPASNVETVAVGQGLRASTKLKLGLAALALVVAGGYALHRDGTPRDAPERPRRVEVSPNIVVDPPAPRPATQVPRADDASVSTEAPDAPAKDVRRARKPRAGIWAAPAVLDPQAELSLLSRARRVLAGAPARALALTHEHEETFPRGMFVQEREVIAVEALVKLGRSSEARARATSFERNYPRSTHLARVRVILSTP